VPLESNRRGSTACVYSLKGPGAWRDSRVSRICRLQWANLTNNFLVETVVQSFNTYRSPSLTGPL
jgi:hypothetical protein